MITTIWHRHWTALAGGLLPRGAWQWYVAVCLAVLISFAIVRPFLCGVSNILVLAALALVAIKVGYEWLSWSRTGLALTDDQLQWYEERPFLQEASRVLLLDRVQNATYRKNGIVDNLLNRGTVIVEASGTEVDVVATTMPDPSSIARIIISRVPRRDGRHPGP